MSDTDTSTDSTSEEPTVISRAQLARSTRPIPSF